MHVCTVTVTGTVAQEDSGPSSQDHQGGIPEAPGQRPDATQRVGYCGNRPPTGSHYASTEPHTMEHWKLTLANINTLCINSRLKCWINKFWGLWC